MSFNIRNTGNVRLRDIFLRFIDEKLLNQIIQRVRPDQCSLGIRRSRSKKYKGKEAAVIGMKSFKLKTRYVYQKLAIETRIIGAYHLSTENNPVKRHLRTSVKEAITYFQNKYGMSCVNSEIIERLIVLIQLSADDTVLLTKNFQSIVLRLGQNVSGDEKLFFFTGDSGNVRLVISKPDRIGLWFYELVARLSCNLPYMLSTLMHSSLKGSVTVASVVQSWVDVIESIGSDCFVADEIANPDTYLAMDSYYMDASVREMMKSHQRPYTASVKPDRFIIEKTIVHPDGRPDQPGEWKGIFNETTEELFIYHYDTQKGVGIKYNLSRGFERSTDKYKIRDHKDRIPVYDNYKTFFMECDDFNRALHDRTWPHKHGGGRNGEMGEYGTHHDFLMACTLQNTINAWLEITGTNPKEFTFKQMMLQLSDELYELSLTFP